MEKKSGPRKQTEILERESVRDSGKISKISIYGGYRVTRSKFHLASTIERERFELKVGTSRYGTPVGEVWS
ncbi:MAG: hypothetical protein ACLP5V_04945 [Candidatus Bathyarchaeia archaeon]